MTSLNHFGSLQDVTVCASTGVAAIHVNGCTFHSFLGCGHGSEEQWKKAKVAKSKKQVSWVEGSKKGVGKYTTNKMCNLRFVCATFVCVPFPGSPSLEKDRCSDSG